MIPVDFVRITSLTESRETRPGFELALPNPILGKSIFLLLPPHGQWRYEVDAATLRAERNLILRDHMWVTRGQAQFVAVHVNGARAEVSLKIKPWKPEVRSEAARLNAVDCDPDKGAQAEAAEDRKVSNSPLGRLVAKLRKPRKQRMIIRCGHTERKIAITARLPCSQAPSESQRLADLLAAVRCH